ncbi:conserved hypothetical protein [Histoplasma capsulatum var. duboisii H88]|uniref:Uncharacterized protein n=1 Tax=Ajellomyces capsulatus (strain H88) TaxID=544711 RepID=F0UF25_AJEC8|nr:conserved hypothetical protein [Histoplasma capsulatum var. duboisii H88]QSS55661.1 hypothetical protein I7I53_03605 [Histoplasma capsulatum var. duboisii H88]
MAYYEPQSWQAPLRQTSWEQPAPPSRSGTSSTSQRDDAAAFSSQFDEVDRAIDNLVKSGKLFNAIPRRDSVPLMMSRPYPDYDPRMMNVMPQRHSAIGDYESLRPHSASNVQGFYAAQRYQGRPNEVEQMMQAKRRMAAQREGELRKYHHQQQIHRLSSEMSGNKSDRSMSPAAMSDESRREWIARQRRALYGNGSPDFYPNGGMGEEHHNSRQENQTSGSATTAAAGVRGPSPRGVDPFGLGQTQGQGNSENVPQPTQGANARPSPAVPQSLSPTNSNASPSSRPTSYGIFDTNPGQQQQPHASASPGDESVSSRQLGSKQNVPSVGPIGSRPTVQQSASSQAVNAALNKRSTTPLPSPLGYGFSPNEAANNNTNTSGNGNGNGSGNERSTSSASNPSTSTIAPASGSGVNESSGHVGLGWGNGSGVWRSKNSLGVQASVWG